MMRKVLVLLAAALAAPALAKPMIPRLPSNSDLVANLPNGTALETRLDADLNGDGIRDTAAVVRSDDERKLFVMLGYSSETDLGYRTVGSLTMDISPLGDAQLSVRNGVLIVEDLSGGTTAVASLYRFRYEAPVDRMQLIGDDVTLYSRTNMHGSVNISTNRLTGVRITKRSELRGKGENASLVPSKPVMTKISRKPVYMEEAPDPTETVGFGD